MALHIKKRRGSGMQRLKIDPDFDPIRAEPRYQELLRKMNFTPVPTQKPVR